MILQEPGQQGFARPVWNQGAVPFRAHQIDDGGSRTHRDWTLNMDCQNCREVPMLAQMFDARVHFVWDEEDCREWTPALSFRCTELPGTQSDKLSFDVLSSRIGIVGVGNLAQYCGGSGPTVPEFGSPGSVLRRQLPFLNASFAQILGEASTPIQDPDEKSILDIATLKVFHDLSDSFVGPHAVRGWTGVRQQLSDLVISYSTSAGIAAGVTCGSNPIPKHFSIECAVCTLPRYRRPSAQKIDGPLPPRLCLLDGQIGLFLLSVLRFVDDAEDLSEESGIVR